MPTHFKSNLLGHCYIFLWLLKFSTFFNNLSTVLVLWILVLPFYRNWSLKGCVILFWKNWLFFLSPMIFDVLSTVAETDNLSSFEMLSSICFCIMQLFEILSCLWFILLSTILLYLFLLLTLRWWLSKGLINRMCPLFQYIYL